MRLIESAAERRLHGKLLERHHYLHNANAVGQVLRYVVEYHGEWVAVMTFCSAALHLKPRDRLLKWTARQGRDQPADYFQSFQGAHKAMTFEHIPWGVVLDGNATLDTLKKFSVVMLPNVAIVSAKEVALFRRYVEEAGKLIVTGLTGGARLAGRDQFPVSAERTDWRTVGW